MSATPKFPEGKTHYDGLDDLANIHIRWYNMGGLAEVNRAPIRLNKTPLY